MNLVILSGNLGKDPETTKSNSGMTICKFSVATTHSVKKGNDWEEETSWHRVVSFGKTADAIDKHFKKGDQIIVEGRISYGSYVNKDEQTVYTTDIILNKFEFGSMRSKQGGGDSSGIQNEAPARAKSAPASSQSFDDDDIPF